MNKTIIALFGATGDLSIKKLLPAIANLIKNQDFAGELSILALGRREFSTEEYLSFVSSNKTVNGDLELLRKHLSYVKMDIGNENDYKDLKNILTGIRRNYQTREIFYLAVGPDLFIPITRGLSKTKIVRKKDPNSVIAFEKPFGHDFREATEINDFLLQNFSEKQIYRVDHYLGKEMIQNILSLRFSNILLSSVWSEKYIAKVNIAVLESENISNRGSYYDKAGVLKDMVQSHLLQMLSLIAMNPPKSLFSDDVKNEKVKVLKKVRVVSEDTVLGQYDGYLAEKGVEKNSQTPTLACIHLAVDTPRFKNVPFYLYTGKKLAAKEAYIEIIFKKTSFGKLFHDDVRHNSLKITFAPDSEIGLTLNAKKPGFGSSLEEIRFDHCYSCEFQGNIKEAYEKLFLEMINAHKTLFTRWDEICLSWQIINEIRKHTPKLIKYSENFDIFCKDKAI